MLRLLPENDESVDAFSSGRRSVSAAIKNGAALETGPSDLIADDPAPSIKQARPLSITLDRLFINVILSVD